MRRTLGVAGSLLGIFVGCGSEVTFTETDDDGTGAGATSGTTTGVGAGSSTGGGPTTTGVGGGPGGCGPIPAVVYGCVPLAQPPGSSTTYKGLVVGMYEDAPAEACNSDPAVMVPAWSSAPATATIIELAIDAGPNVVPIAVSTPGFTTSSLTPGQEATIVVTDYPPFEFGEHARAIEIYSGNVLVGLVGQNLSGPLTVTEGAEVCYFEDDLCGVGRRAMQAQSQQGGAEIAPGQTAAVGDLLVTNDAFDHFYDISGGCNFGQPTSFRIGAAHAGFD